MMAGEEGMVAVVEERMVAGEEERMVAVTEIRIRVLSRVPVDHRRPPLRIRITRHADRGTF